MRITFLHSNHSMTENQGSATSTVHLDKSENNNKNDLEIVIERLNNEKLVFPSGIYILLNMIFLKPYYHHLWTNESCSHDLIDARGMLFSVLGQPILCC